MQSRPELFLSEVLFFGIDSCCPVEIQGVTFKKLEIRRHSMVLYEAVQSFIKLLTSDIWFILISGVICVMSDV